MRKLIFILIALVSFSQAQTIQTIGSPTTTVVSRGNFRTDSIFYLPKRTKIPTDTAAFRYQISDSSLYYWTGYQWMKVGNNQDTASMLSNYVRGSGTTNYFPKFNSTRSIVDSKLYESNLNLLFNSTTPYLTTSGISTIENNGTSASLYVLKTLDTARAYVSFGGANTMDINNLRAGDIRFYTNATLRGRFQTDGTFRLNSLTGTGSRIVVADANGVLSATSSATDLIDTTYISSRAWRQKGDDSLGAIIATKGSGTVTSVATGYGLSGGTITTTGTISADTALMATRLRVGKVVDSLSLVKQNVLTNPITGTGTSGYIPKWNGTTTQSNSLMYDNGSGIGINTTSPNQKLTIQSGTGDVAGVTFRANGLTSSDEVFVGQGSSGSAFISNRSTNSITFQIGGFTRMNLTNNAELFVNTTSDAGDYKLQVAGNILGTGTLNISGSTVLANSSGDVGIGLIAAGQSGFKNLEIGGSGVSGLIDLYQGTSRQLRIYNSGTDSYLANVTNGGGMLFRTTTSGGTQNNNLFITSSGEILINTTTDAGAYTLQNNGALYNTGSAILAATSGNVGIGTTSPTQKLDVSGITRVNGGTIYAQASGTESGQYQLNALTFGYDATNAVGWITAGGAAARTNLILQEGGGTTTAFVGIGTRTPTEKLHVVGNIYNTSSTYFNATSGESYFGTTTDAGNYRVQVSGNAYVSGSIVGGNTTNAGGSDAISLWGQNSSYLRNTSDAFAHSLDFYKSRGSAASPTDVSSGDGSIQFRSVFYSGGYKYLNALSVEVDGSFTSGQNPPQRIRFWTNAANGSTTERLRITSDGIVAINNNSPSASAQLDVSSTTRGFLPPRMTTAQRDAISSPAAGLVIYNTTTSKLQVYTTSWTDLH